tara:strand:- start:833 stop:1597 length:765 start_codon:yes stop_codon:yes gene_type:complete
MAPRGLKTAIRKTIPAKLVGSKQFRAFQAIKNGVLDGPKLRGLTKALEASIWSLGTLPPEAVYGSVRRGGWAGKNGGRRRGVAIDSQLTRCINSGKIKPKKGQYTLTKLTLTALAVNGLEPVACQRAVCNTDLRIGSAIDILAYEKSTSQLVVVELKCGFSGDRVLAARRSGKACTMRKTLHKATDTVLNRHFAQLACTHAMFCAETGTLKTIHSLGVAHSIGAALLYVNDVDTALYPLSAWWTKRAERILKDL